MRQGHQFASVVAGLLGVGLAGCAPPSYEYDWNIDTYKAEVTQGEPITWKAPLYRVAGGPDAGASGTLDIVDIPTFTKWPDSTNRSDRYKVRAHLRGMTPFQDYVVSQEDVGTLGILVPTDLHGNGDAGESLSYGIPSPAYTVLVKDPGGQIVLVGEVPEAGSAGTRIGEYEEAGGSRRLAVSTSVSTASGRETVDFAFSDFPVAQGGELFVWQEGGPFLSAGVFTANGNGKATLSWDSRDGAPLPGGAISVRRLYGVAFEVRVEGIVVLEGALP